MTRYDEIRTRCEAATKGEWGVWTVQDDDAGTFECGVMGPTEFYENGGCGNPGIPKTLADAEFIAHAREDVPYLLGEIERYRGELQQIVSIGTSLKGEHSAAAEIAAEALAVKP